jgi:hypothetical protein
MPMTVFVTMSGNFVLLISIKFFFGGGGGGMWACAATAITPGTVETFVTGLGLYI